METIKKIYIEKILHDVTIGSSRLEFSIHGDNINSIVMNTIRRAIYKYVPIFIYKNFKFEKNTSVYHNNMLKLRFESMPVYGILNNYNIYDNIDLDNVKNLTMYLSYHNKEKENKIITTDDILFYYDNKLIKNPYEKLGPITMVKLREDEEINFTIMTAISIEDNVDSNINSAPVSICTYIEHLATKFSFILESRGQLTEKKILIVAIENIQYRLNKILINVINGYEYKDHTKGEIKICNEENTIGNLITDGLQNHKNIDFAGYRLEHPLIKNIYIEYKTNNNIHIRSIFKDVVEYYNKLFLLIKELIENKL